jgi:hypothetical protein
MEIWIREIACVKISRIGSIILHHFSEWAIPEPQKSTALGPAAQRLSYRIFPYTFVILWRG